MLPLSGSINTLETSHEANKKKTNNNESSILAIGVNFVYRRWIHTRLNKINEWLSYVANWFTLER